MNTHNFVVMFSSSIKKIKTLKETNLKLLWSICVFSEQEHLLLQPFNTSHCIFRIIFFKNKTGIDCMTF